MSNTNESWMSNNENFLNSLIKMRLENNKKKVPLSTAVLNFLKSTTIPYVIIGGKAAEFYIKRNVNKSKFNKQNILLAESTNDYDILVKSEQYDKFISDLSEYILFFSENKANYHVSNMKNTRIFMLGIRNKDKVLDDILDIHEYKNKLPNRLFNKSSGLYFASKDKIISNLKYSLKHHSSTLQPTKTLKRQMRLKLLTT